MLTLINANSNSQDFSILNLATTFSSFRLLIFSWVILLDFDAGDESYLNTLRIRFKVFQEYS